MEYEKLDYLGVAVDDLDETLDFFDTLGFDSDRYSETEAMVTPAADSAYLYLFETVKDGAPGRDEDFRTNPVGLDHVSFRVKDVDETYETLRNRGIDFLFPVTRETWGLRIAAVNDPSGNLIYFVTKI